MIRERQQGNSTGDSLWRKTIDGWPEAQRTAWTARAAELVAQGLEQEAAEKRAWEELAVG
jgi:hypothetical protein